MQTRTSPSNRGAKATLPFINQLGDSQDGQKRLLLPSRYESASRTLSGCEGLDSNLFPSTQRVLSLSLSSFKAAQSRPFSQSQNSSKADGTVKFKVHLAFEATYIVQRSCRKNSAQPEMGDGYDRVQLQRREGLPLANLRSF